MQLLNSILICAYQEPVYSATPLARSHAWKPGGKDGRGTGDRSTCAPSPTGTAPVTCTGVASAGTAGRGDGGALASTDPAPVLGTSDADDDASAPAATDVMPAPAALAPATDGLLRRTDERGPRAEGEGK